MTSTVLKDGRVLHIPGAPFLTDSVSVIMAPADDELASYVPLIRGDELLLFAKRLVDGARKRRREPRYVVVNRARLELAKRCIDRAIAEQFSAPPAGADDA